MKKMKTFRQDKLALSNAFYGVVREQKERHGSREFQKSMEGLELLPEKIENKAIMKITPFKKTPLSYSFYEHLNMHS